MGGPLVTPPEGRALAALAARAVSARLSSRQWNPEKPSSPALCAAGASFVTLERSGRLRGCVGVLEAVRPLYLDVAGNAVRAMADPRFPDFSAEEWEDLDITVSVLTPPEPLPAIDITDVTRALRPGVDGLILSDGHRRATFLPTVWRKLRDPERFVAALLAKGGWSLIDPPALTAQRYTATEFSDPGPRPPLDG
jgi:AmmeMemoRadiSam system protein A